MCSGVIVSGNSLWSRRGNPERAAFMILSLDDVFLVAYLWGSRVGGEFLILCDSVPVSSEEGLEIGEVWGVGCN